VVIEADVGMLIEIRNKTRAEAVLAHVTELRPTLVILPVVPHFWPALISDEMRTVDRSIKPGKMHISFQSATNFRGNELAFACLNFIVP
jgi:hypothetical protein